MGKRVKSYPVIRHTPMKPKRKKIKIPKPEPESFISAKKMLFNLFWVLVKNFPWAMFHVAVLQLVTTYYGNDELKAKIILYASKPNPWHRYFTSMLILNGQPTVRIFIMMISGTILEAKQGSLATLLVYFFGGAIGSCVEWNNFHEHIVGLESWNGNAALLVALVVHICMITNLDSVAVSAAVAYYVIIATYGFIQISTWRLMVPLLSSAYAGLCLATMTFDRTSLTSAIWKGELDDDEGLTIRIKIFNRFWGYFLLLGFSFLFIDIENFI